MDPTDHACRLDKEANIWHVNSSDNFLSDIVIVFIPSLAQATSTLFCFTAIGTTSAFTIAVEGTFTIGIVMKM